MIFLRIRLTTEDPLAMAEKILVIVARTGVIAEKSIRIVGEIGVTAKETFRAAENTEVTIEEISGTTGDTEVITEEVSGVNVETEAINEEISRVTGDSGLITEGVSEGIVKFDGITNDIIPQGEITGTDILQSVTGINIQVDHTEEETGEKLKDVRFLPV